MLVKESISQFVRSGDIKRSLSLGDNFYALKKGALLISTKIEGISSSGKFTAPYKASHRKWKDRYYLLLEDPIPNERNPNFYYLQVVRLTDDWNLALEIREFYLQNGLLELMAQFTRKINQWWSKAYIQISDISEKKFNNRFKIVLNR